MDKKYLSVVDQSFLSNSIRASKEYRKRLNIGSMSRLTLKRYFMSYLSKLIPGAKMSWRRLLTPLGLLGIVYMVLKTSYVELAFVKTPFQQLEHLLIWILGVWAGPVQRVVYYSLLLLAPRIFKGFRIKNMGSFLGGSYRGVVETKMNQVKKMTMKIALFGVGSGLLIGTFIGDYKLKGFGALILIVLGIWNKMSQGKSFQFMKALQNDFARIFKIKRMPSQFERQFLLGFTAGIFLTPAIAFIAKATWIRLLPPIVLFIVVLVLFLTESKKEVIEHEEA